MQNTHCKKLSLIEDNFSQCVFLATVVLTAL